MVKKKTPLRKTARSRPVKFKPTEHARNYAQIAWEYAVAADKDKKNETHCKWVRLAAKRFLDDLKGQRFKTCPHRFDPWHANDICDFIENLPHVEGQWDTPTITLEPPQIFILVNIFGWRRKSDGLRRFTSVYIEMARKGAKSTLTSGVSLYCLTCENEVGPQIVIGASTGDQANKVFGPAKRMVERTMPLQEHFDLEAWSRSITCRQNGGYIQPINSKSSTQDGWNPHMGILDELHAHKDRGLFDVIRSAFGSRKNPLMWSITTAGYDTQGVCFEQHKLVKKILESTISADHYFGIIFTLDENDNEYDSEVWIKANPMLGITPTLDSMKSYAEEAKAAPGVAYEFKTKRLNVWTTAKGAWLNMEYWKQCNGAVNPDAYIGQSCFGGIDLAAVSDITAFVLLWIIDNRIKVYPRFYLPEDTIEEHVKKRSLPYRQWVDQGLIIATPGNATDYSYIELDVERAMSKFSVEMIGYDPWNATHVVNNLTDGGAPMVEMRQGARTFNTPMSELERAVQSNLVDHGGNPVLSWMASNLVARYDANENKAPDKKNSEEKIDGMVALLMALGCALSDPTTEGSLYEEQKLFSLGVD